MVQKYQRGDRVKVLVGHRIWVVNYNERKERDIAAYLKDDIATVQYTYGQMSEVDKRFSKSEIGYKEYCLKFDKYGTIAWFDEEIIIPATDEDF